MSVLCFCSMIEKKNGIGKLFDFIESVNNEIKNTTNNFDHEK